MNEPHLPEDLARWPADPYQLLGVRPNTGPQDVRRAYTRLIRTYKPEQYPEHFRRIREAYDFVKEHVDFMASMRLSHLEDEEYEPEVEDLDEHLERELPAWSTQTGIDEELDDLWHQACSGRESAAYQRLVELETTHPGSADVCIRLYWLLALSPDLDPKRTASDWLIRNLERHGFRGRLRELYRREIAENPAEGVRKSCTNLLNQPWDAGSLADLAEWRWQAAARLDSWQIIDADLQSLAPRLALENQDIWLRLLITAVEQLITCDTDSAALNPWAVIQRIMKDINGFGHLDTPHAALLDRLEFSVEVADGLRFLRRHRFEGTDFVGLVQMSLGRSFTEIRPALMAYLARQLEDPWMAMEDLVEVKRLAMPVLTQYGSLLTTLQQSTPSSETRSPEDLDELVNKHLNEGEHRHYSSFRKHLLQFCLRQSVQPDVVAQYMYYSNLADMVENDWPLRYVCLGYQLFWA